MLNVSPHIFYNNGTIPTNAGHSIVVSGYKKGVVCIDDPCTNLIEISEDHLIEAWENYANTHSTHWVAIFPKVNP